MQGKLHQFPSIFGMIHFLEQDRVSCKAKMGSYNHKTLYYVHLLNLLPLTFKILKAKKA